jgi:hypothetical protein
MSKVFSIYHIVISSWHKRVQLVEEDHTRRGRPRSGKHLPDGSLAFSDVLQERENGRLQSQRHFANVFVPCSPC